MSKTPTSRSLADILGTTPDAIDEVRRAGMSSSIPLTQPDAVTNADDPATDATDATDATADVEPTDYADAADDPATSRRMTGGGGRKRLSRKGLWWIIAACVAVVVIVGLILYFTLRAPKSTTTTRTQDFTVATTTMSTSVSASGTIQPAQRADLSFTSAGTVDTLSVSVGDTVTSGEALASIDTTDLQTAVDQAQAAVNAAQTDYNTAVSSGSSTQQTAAKSTLTTKQNALANAQTALTNATLTAPFDGTVAIVNIAIGDKVGSTGSTGTSANTGTGNPGSNANITGGANATSASSSAAITVITTNTYQVTTSVGSADVGNIQPGQACTITPDSTNTQLQGTVASVGVVASSSTSSGATFPVVIDVTGTPDGLYAGVSASISIITSSRTVLAVPTAAITRQGPNEYVDVKDASGNTTQTQIQTGATSGGMTEVTSGVQAGDVVVITITIQTGGNANSGGFGGVFGGSGGNRQRPSGFPSGGNFQGGNFGGGGGFQGPGAGAQPGQAPS